MKWSHARSVVEELRQDTRLYLPALTKRRGFSTSRVEHLLNRLVQAMPATETYLEVGTLEGRTLEAAAHANDGKRLIGVDPCMKYDLIPESFAPNIVFIQATWQDAITAKGFPMYGEPVGCVFYDGLHDEEETESFMVKIAPSLADEAVLVMDDWDRVSVRRGTYKAEQRDPRWQLLNELPCYGDGLTAPQQHFGYSFGISVWGFKR